ncbi:MAG: CZB domain-containing protein [Candidatus Methylumidiphilus sp.]
MTLYQEIDKAQAGHGLWKSRLARAIASGEAKISPQQAAADDCCDFGRWLYALPPHTHRSPLYNSVRKLHAQFHKQAALVLRLALAGHRDVAKLAMMPGSGFQRVSDDLAKALRRWQQASLRNKPSK